MLDLTSFLIISLLGILLIVENFRREKAEKRLQEVVGRVRVQALSGFTKSTKQISQTASNLLRQKDTKVQVIAMRRIFPQVDNQKSEDLLSHTKAGWDTSPSLQKSQAKRSRLKKPDISLAGLRKEI